MARSSSVDDGEPRLPADQRSLTDASHELVGRVTSRRARATGPRDWPSGRDDGRWKTRCQLRPGRWPGMASPWCTRLDRSRPRSHSIAWRCRFSPHRLLRGFGSWMVDHPLAAVDQTEYPFALARRSRSTLQRSHQRRAREFLRGICVAAGSSRSNSRRRARIMGGDGMAATIGLADDRRGARRGAGRAGTGLAAALGWAV